MAKLRKDQVLWVAEYAHFVQRHAHIEQALRQAAFQKASEETRIELIEQAKWFASEAVRAANRIGLPKSFIQSDILQRADTTPVLENV